MIRINLLAADVLKKKRLQLRKYLIGVYAILWVVLLMVMYLKIQNNLNFAKQYHKELTLLKTKIDRVAPDFKMAVSLYQQRNRFLTKLSGPIKSTVEPEFILRSLYGLSKKTTNNIWIEEISLSAMENKDKADNNKKPLLKGRSMSLKGNLFVQPKSATPNPVERFYSDLQTEKPFSYAQGKLNLNNMTLRKIDARYSYNFVIQFNWEDMIL